MENDQSYIIEIIFKSEIMNKEKYYLNQLITKLNSIVAEHVYYESILNIFKKFNIDAKDIFLFIISYSDIISTKFDFMEINEYKNGIETGKMKKLIHHRIESGIIKIEFIGPISLLDESINWILNEIKTIGKKYIEKLSIFKFQNII